ncbi:TPA: RIP metalloprotease RseP [Streptococcus pyogenes]|uniref:RIP metalloprotease RseP n=1 Tax=Streptococcus pyogenes TaxID=1314 RepID=UPI001CF3B1CC|nr:RIP metalloprotease RseP [Streptococcus pyogenes]HER4575691.1 RIP metalloprotease RseP [Streptococcus pyogenes NGAS643]HER4578815.1 RIP metalloprotease RseP [Streptococcus pyogenes NGAS633]HER4584201.1 RIP metalloprotease RseP [Streptococcus pyogenes NGAS655]HER4714051.1 RIP metalloprotease RseP [Streptococcus pyogenes NGAS320]HER4717507.1 RIP metalloprotease RseP [Streptococcus pyogenes NGAS306]HER4725250.1 RIP metalloprotease RseP [Streptococcus pyogenes NGAS319]HER4741305.1 RIP metallo
MLGIITFIIIFGILVIVHEFGHFYFAKKSGILVREFAIGMGPKIFSHVDQGGTLYTLRMLPLGGYVRMAGWGDDKTEIKTGTPASLTLNEQGFVKRINLSQSKLDPTSLPMHVTGYDLEDQLSITGLVLDETKTYKVAHDATIVEEDGTEIRIAPLDVQYQNASIGGRLITNFAGPMNNFILGIVVFILLVFLQGGMPDFSSNHVRVQENGAAAKAGLRDNDQIVAINGYKVTSWNDLTEAVNLATRDLGPSQTIKVTYKSHQRLKTVAVKPQKHANTYTIGVKASLKTGFKDKLLGGLELAWSGAFTILNALKGLITGFSLNKLGGPVAMYDMSNQAAQNGLESVLSLMAMLSINLGIFNLIPIPALDGGKILMNIIEAIRRKPIKQETEAYITLAGVAIMVVLMIAVTWNDIMRVFF